MTDRVSRCILAKVKKLLNHNPTMKIFVSALVAAALYLLFQYFPYIAVGIVSTWILSGIACLLWFYKGRRGFLSFFSFAALGLLGFAILRSEEPSLRKS